MHHDFVLTCYEPVTRVTGGIGSYTRLLLGERRRLGLPTLFLTSERNELPPELVDPLVRVERVPERAFVEGAPLNNLEHPQREYAFNLLQRLQALAARGDTFGLIEVPDYGSEGFFLARARKYGLLAFERLAVRLHSPVLMLTEDNDQRAFADPQRLRCHSEELSVYAEADHVLYGGDAMLERVLGLVGPGLQERMRARAVKIPHPWPPPGPLSVKGPAAGPLQVGYVGRLEYRKGVDLLLRAFLAATEASGGRAVLNLFGGDTQTWRGESVRYWLETLIPEGRQGDVVFHDSMPQQELWSAHLPRMDVFVYPSRFENYPNALLEVLALGRPVLVSKHGCMPELGREFDSVQAVDPLDVAVLTKALAEQLARGPVAHDVAAHYRAVAKDMNEQLAQGYARLLAQRPGPRAEGTGPRLPMAFVIPHYDRPALLEPLLRGLKPQLEPGDEMIVVDDASPGDAGAAAAGVAAAFGAKFHALQRNSGPSAARNAGVQLTSAPLLAFVDGDDELAPGAVKLLREAFVRDPSVEVVTGFFRAFGDHQHAWAAYDATIGGILQTNSSHCGIVVRRETLARAGGYQEAQRVHVEDWELNMRLALNGARFEVLPAVTYLYRVNLSTGRQRTNAAYFAASEEQALRHALGSLGPEQLLQVWPELQDTLVAALLRRPPVVEVVPNVLRYKIADKVNALVKQTAVHGALKRTLARLVPPRR